MQENTSGLVRVLLFGGIGNQLFQYANGVKLAAEQCGSIVLDLRGLPSRGQQKGASITDLKFPIQTIGKQGALRNYLWKPFLRNSFGPGHSPISDWMLGVSRQRTQGANESKASIIADYFIDTDAIKYLTHFSPLSLTDPLTPEVAKEYQICGSDHVIVIHHRLGDSLRIKSSRGQLGPDYFKKGIDRIRREYPGARQIRVHSDEPRLSKKLLGRWIEGEDVSWASEDLSAAESLTSLARANHLILSNSTMSWWAAAGGVNKLVIGPSRWSKSGQELHNLPGWQAIEPDWI